MYNMRFLKFRQGSSGLLWKMELSHQIELCLIAIFNIPSFDKFWLFILNTSRSPA